MSTGEKKVKTAAVEKDLRKQLMMLYLKNNPKLEHKIFIYSYRGVVDDITNPFHYAGADLAKEIKKSLIVQNLASGEMMQAFFVPSKAPQIGYSLENTVLYGNKSGVLVEIGLNETKVEQSEKYRQFSALIEAILRQFV